MEGYSPESISVLHVDDEPDFTDLAATFLERIDDRFTVETATSAEEGLGRIREEPPDCVVSDYNMPGTDGIEFLQRVREDYPELPFVLFTGKGSEAVASEAISAGVTDYLQKSTGTDRYELLANRIQNAVEAQKTAQKASRQEELMRLTEFAGDTGGWEMDTETENIVMTDGARRIADLPGEKNISLEDAVGMYHPEDREELRQSLNTSIEEGEETEGTWRLQQDGDERTVKINITPVVENGETKKLRGAIHDVTEVRERRRELEQIETIFENTQDSLFLINVGEEFTVERVNPVYEDATGLSAEEVCGKTPKDILGEEAGANAEAKYDECVNRQEPLRYEESVRIGEGLAHWKTKIAPVTIGGEVEYIAGSTRDVTEQKNRKKELESERRFIQQALDTLDDLFYVLDTEGRIERWNREFLETTGYTESELDGMEATEFFPQEERGKVADAVQETLEDGSATVEADLLTADGERIRYEFTGARLTDGDGNKTGLVGIGRDLTERRKREHRFRALIENSNDIITVVDGDGVHKYQSPSVSRILGYEPEEVVGDTAFEYVHPEDRKGLMDEFEKSIAKEGENPVAEYRVRDADGSWRWIESRGNNQLDNPAVEGYIINSRDVTERKERECELERTQDLMSKMEGLAGVGAWEYNTETEQLTLTQGACRIYGVEPDADLGLDEAFSYIHREDRELLTDRFNECIETGEPYNIEVRLTTYEGEQRWVKTKAERNGTDGGGTVVRGYMQDITEQRSHEHELRKYRKVFDELPDPVVVYDESGQYELVNEAAAEILGTPREKLEGEKGSCLERIRRENPDEYEALTEGSQEVLRTKLTGEFSGEIERTLECRLCVMAERRFSDSIVAVNRDITERERDKRELERYETVIEALSDSVYMLNEEGRFSYVNDNFVELVGYGRDTVIGNTPSLIKDEDSIEEAEQELGRLLSADGPETTKFEVTVRPQDGEPIVCQDHMGVLPYEGEEFNGSVGILRDITEENERRRELERKNERLEEFASVVSHDLRNPLEVARGRLELAQEDCDSPHIEDAVGAIERCGDLIGSLLTLAREGEDVSGTENVDMKGVVIESWQTVGTEEGSLSADIDTEVSADPNRLRQMLENIFRNAVEHAGRDVTVKVGEIEDEKTDGFYIEDDGSGIPEKRRSEVFDAGYSTADNGAGLGLRIVEDVVAAHGWNIELKEGHDGGTRFEVFTS